MKYKREKYYSQHAEYAGNFGRVINDDMAHELGNKLLTDSSLIKTSVYFRYYLFQALNKGKLWK